MPKPKRLSKRRKGFLSVIARLLLYFIMFSLAWVGLYRWVNPPYTFLMLQNTWNLSEQEKQQVPKRKWLPYDALSENLKRAIIAAEDAHFMQHTGFDTQAIKTAYQKNKEGQPLRGGSTISQQTAKNIFLWPQRSWLRKGLEAWFTLLIEALWGKQRILEVYLNSIEMGRGVYGAEAACRYYYHKSASALTRSQAAHLAAILPAPTRWSPTQPSPFISRKAQNILRYMSHSSIP